MHEAALAQAALPAPTIVLGLPLRPYSLGHELFLVRENNPLCVPNVALEDIRFHHLTEAVLICSQSWAENLSVNNDWLIRLKLKIWGRRIRKMEFDEELELFRSYRSLGEMFFPTSDRLKPGSKSARMPGCPFLLRLHQFLVTRLRMSAEAAWDYPKGLAVMQWQTYWESEDRMEIYNSHDAEFDAFVEKMEKEAACQA